jgi:threonine aldolase
MNPEVETKIVFIDLAVGRRDVKDVLGRLQRQGVRMGSPYGGMIRAVTHLDVSKEDIEAAGRAFAEAVGN